MSGSPIVLAGVNKVVGVHFMSSGSTGYAICTEAIREYLEEYLQMVNPQVGIRLILVEH